MNNALRLTVQKITKLPTLPVIAQEILDIIDSETTSPGDLEQIIRRDPAIAAKILSFSSSAFFGSSSPPANIQEAVFRIGFNNVKNITIGISLMTVLDDGNRHILDYERIYRHSLIVGSVAKYLAKTLNVPATSGLFLYGLLHDIGYLVINRYLEENYRNVLNECRDGVQMLEAEKKVLGFNHAEIGRWLADKWNLPETVKNIILYHHNPVDAQENLNEIGLIHLADYITSRKLMNITNIESTFQLDLNVLGVFHISEDGFCEIIKGIVEENII